MSLTNINIRILLLLLLLLLFIYLFIYLSFSRAWMKITLCSSSLPCLNNVLLLLLLLLLYFSFNLYFLRGHLFLPRKMFLEHQEKDIK